MLIIRCIQVTDSVMRKRYHMNCRRPVSDRLGFTEVSSWILGGAVTAGVIIDITIFSKTVGMIRVVKAYANCFKLLVTEGFEVAYQGMSVPLLIDACRLTRFASAFKGLRAGLAAVAGKNLVILDGASNKNANTQLRGLHRGQHVWQGARNGSQVLRIPRLGRRRR